MPAPYGPKQTAPRIVGVDVARGLALLGMFSVHVFGAFDEAGSPTPAWMFAGGRSSATFAVTAGIGLAFTTGGRRPATGRPAAVAVAARAGVIALIGLLLGYASRAADLDVDVILVFYALLFLIAIPLLGLGPRTLTALSLSLAVGAPFAVHALRGSLPRPAFDGDPTLQDVVTDPLGLLSDLLVHGDYPVLAWTAYLCAGLALGRLDLTSRGLAPRLLGGGLALVAGVWLVSSLVLFRFDGLRQLWGAEFPGASRAEALWDSPAGVSWWALLSRAPHATTPFDLLLTLGSAAAILGGALLLTRSALLTRALTPLAAAGSMPLTLYAAHVLLLATGALSGSPELLYAVMTTGALLFALSWRHVGRGPLETVVAGAARRCREAVTPPRPPEPVADPVRLSKHTE
ncbi:heparan-alpha-glucosaminide N-acetyltransferase domain-containing protein [Streptomyces pseudovenezuelae]|uniref:heparan-alpha-glucosaminide N-acetyltransferase domain-containing protein n=1 Tax=Streptomyces pseudovenezuelae TaxID=67350 RepID=UPI002E36B753|nr:heparan-alpha-glucosaminide N-acetyltransferase domain-containing protein [Streptomyces pseudovenezuelae]